MPLKITVQYVSPGAVNGAPFIRPLSFMPDALPFEVIVPDTESAGVTVATLKKFLFLAQEGKIDSASPGTFEGDSVKTGIDASYLDNA